MFEITQESINTSQIIAFIENSSQGAIVTFEGRVRDHNLGQSVHMLEYDAFEDLAIKEGQRIIEEALAKFEISTARAIHRIGLLNLKDIAVTIVAASPHREAAFFACKYIIDEVKTRIPIWKKEHYTGGKSSWVDCPTCSRNLVVAPHHTKSQWI